VLTTGNNTTTGNTTISGTLNVANGIVLSTNAVALGIEQSLTLALSDETTSITTGVAKITFRAPFAWTLTRIPRASLSSASVSGIPTVDINVNGNSILSTKLTIDENEKTSTTAATAAALSSTSIADDAEITMDVDVAGSAAKGLKVTLYYKRA
jgi:DNA-directed RNA polymerase beta subunit